MRSETLSRPTSPSMRDNDGATLVVSSSQLLLMRSAAAASSSSKPLHPSLDIELSADKFYFKGVGSAAEPCLVSGELVLNLTESASLKEVTLQLRGKTRLPSLTESGYVHQMLLLLVPAADTCMIHAEASCSQIISPSRYFHMTGLSLPVTNALTLSKRDDTCFHFKYAILFKLILKR